VLAEADPFAYVAVIDLTVHTAYRVLVEVLVCAPESALPVVVVDHPPKLYPVFEKPVVSGSAKVEPPVVYALDAGADPEPPLMLYEMV
jgi:hypothetical protein